ncbi:MAG: PDZ domain-containing protein [Verrucomicrobia bacterium]|nr:PDZ domain-containing protein [Verrucomicrobiota bacterium]
MKPSALAWFLMAVMPCSATPPSERESQKQADVVLLPPFEVRERGMTDFGMSIVTNPEVATGGKIAWMLVGNIVPRSAASQAGLRPGDRIIRVDRVLPSKLSKVEMLTTFFGRTLGARVQLEVADPHSQRHRIVELECNEVRIDKKAQPKVK